jgi:alkanesulfonate monooxygenase SsuD/methylene tetrahydromethanopterin reductase-like flavin-dependent oxidoreductase (luciferase family)
MEQLLDLAIMLRSDADREERELVARLAGRLGYFAVHVPLPPGANLPPEEIEHLADAAAPAMVVVDDGADNVGIVRRNDPELVRQARAALDAMEDRRPLIVAVPISIGRTFNEAVARADRDPRFVGDAHPRESGIFGTFEQAQEQVLALARAGAEVLLVTVPHELDVADVLAQVKALVVGATPALYNR